MKKYDSSIRPASYAENITALTAIILLAISATTFAGKGNGKGGSGGVSGGDPELLPAPVNYQITWIDYDLTETSSLQLADVNSSGVAVGYAFQGVPPDEELIGVMADASGNQWEDLNDYFDEALQAYPGWRYAAAKSITADGDVLGALVPESAQWVDEGFIVVIGNINSDPKTLKTVDSFFNNALNSLPDMSENGDALVQLMWPENDPQSDFHPLYLYPSSGTAQLVPTPGDATYTGSIFEASVNASEQVLYQAQFEVPRNRRSYDTVYRAILWDTDGSLLDLGAVDWQGRIGLSEMGMVYARVDGLPQQWSPSAGWEPIASSGEVSAVSKAATDEQVVICRSGAPDLVFQHGFGAFPIEVMAGLGGVVDIERFTADGRTPSAISLPALGGSGYLLGELPDGTYYYPPYILKPIPVAQ